MGGSLWPIYISERRLVWRCHDGDQLTCQLPCRSMDLCFKGLFKKNVLIITYSCLQKGRNAFYSDTLTLCKANTALLKCSSFVYLLLTSSNFSHVQYTQIDTVPNYNFTICLVWQKTVFGLYTITLSKLFATHFILTKNKSTSNPWFPLPLLSCLLIKDTAFDSAGNIFKNWFLHLNRTSPYLDSSQ